MSTLGRSSGLSETLNQRDALHVLGFFERVCNEVRPHDAETQIDALAKQGTHLLIDRQGARRRDGEVARRRQPDDPAAWEDAVGRTQNLVAGKPGELLIEFSDARDVDGLQ